MRFGVPPGSGGGYNSFMASTSQSAAAAFRATLDLFETGLRLMRQNLRRNHPEATEQEIDRQLRQWLHHRPGAEPGDCPGRLVDVNSRRR
jgi:Rv0078B-related antitoxin